MKTADWLVKEDGICCLCKSVREWDLLAEEYRLYRFLTEVEDITRLAAVEERDEETSLSGLRMLVRKLLLNCYTIKTRLPEPNQKTGVSVVMLYDELGFPMSIQTEMNLPGITSSIHNHGTWGIVTVLQGKQKNTFWQRNPTPEFPDKIDRVGERVIEPGDIISFTTEAIHSTEAVGDEPTITFNLYGETHGSKRFQFDFDKQTAKHF
ncbi:putative metal-dependent enzyme of the double-stranded beta helix superfamily [Hyella patelloides LEGE 07179]|uniref:Putative metal-dependent enzyme of the double-stranded beta helix superfamily n=1 Tax=Hyella patelloides LEGE 07179 TaxID=945734 RepID=A0A563VV03_9CYAN|nr:cupin [Hyella patelloides]VEP15269.1 putative metal-dependent enzyme of the double-stranded beta helix superfamily [Hyella patelloides LEGE 07179]